MHVKFTLEFVFGKTYIFYLLRKETRNRSLSHKFQESAIVVSLLLPFTATT